MTLNSRTSDIKEEFNIIEEDITLSENTSIDSRLNQEDFDKILGTRSNEDIIVNAFCRKLTALLEQSALAIVKMQKIR